MDKKNILEKVIDLKIIKKIKEEKIYKISIKLMKNNKKCHFIK